MATKKPKVGATIKSSVRRRMRLVGGDQQATAAFPGSEQDPQRRLETSQGRVSMLASAGELAA